MAEPSSTVPAAAYRGLPPPPSNVTSDCWHCSLVSYQVSYLTSEAMHHFAGFLLPGVIFTILGLRWAVQLLLEWVRSHVTSEVEAAGLPPAPKPPRRRESFCCKTAFTLPWEGIIKLGLTGTGIVVSVLAANPQVRTQEGEGNQFGMDSSKHDAKKYECLRL